MWKLPPPTDLAQQRREVSIDEWPNEDTNTVGTYHCHGDYLSQGSHATVAFAESTSGPRHVPMLISRPITRLSGHHSIVNTALMHPTFPAILTAGIERNILLHSPTPATPFMPSSSLSLTPTEVRALPAEETPESARLVRRALGMSFAGESDEPDDDSMSIALFDQCVVHAVLVDPRVCNLFAPRILRQESRVDVFETRRWSGESEDEEEDTDVSMAYVDAT